ncbi:MAG: RluA family pseudouridine synthase [Candidatus Omnitrophota bacterium]
MNIPIVYEDEWLVVLNKPSGLLTIPTPKNELRTLTSILNEEFKEKGFSFHLHPCHRLDRGTSGLIIYAKGKSIQKIIMQEFKDKKVEKHYIAFVNGRLTQDKGAINNPIENFPSSTKYKVLERRNGFSVVEAIPLTGRTNQIRIHFKIIGHSILGEAKYAFRRDFKIKAKRLCLHAKSLSFIHPVTKKNISFDTELPKDMVEFLRVH